MQSETTMLPAATAGAVGRCRTRSRTAVLRRTCALWLGRTAALARLGCLRLALAAGLRLLGTISATTAAAIGATTAAATTLWTTTTAAATAMTFAAQLDRLRLGLRIGFEAGHDFDRNLTLDETFDVAQQIAFVDADQRHG